jgi:2-dehydropantoate 2-reductase
MLQDFEAGRPLEIDPLLTAVQELGILVGSQTRAIDEVMALLKLKVRSRSPNESARVGK